MEDERDYGAFKQDWDPNYASALKECEAEVRGAGEQSQLDQERYDAMVASGEIVEVEAEEVEPFPF